MRFQVEVLPEDEDPLRHMAVDAHVAVREHASFLLHLKIRELELARLDVNAREAADQVAVG